MTVSPTEGVVARRPISSDGGTFTGPVLFSDGSEAAPSIGFASDPDTGLFLAGAGLLAASVGGNEVFTLAANGVASFYGTAAATYLHVHDNSTTEGNVGVGAAGNNLYLKAGNSLGAVLDFATNFIIGTGALATSATSGFLYIPTCAGTPTGTPLAYGGRVPIVYDTVGEKFWIYNGSWVGVVLA